MLAALCRASADPLSDSGNAVVCCAEGAPHFCCLVASGMVFEIAQAGATPPAIFETLDRYGDDPSENTRRRLKSVDAASLDLRDACVTVTVIFNRVRD